MPICQQNQPYQPLKKSQSKNFKKAVDSANTAYDKALADIKRAEAKAQVAFQAVQVAYKDLTNASHAKNPKPLQNQPSVNTSRTFVGSIT